VRSIGTVSIVLLVAAGAAWLATSAHFLSESDRLGRKYAALLEVEALVQEQVQKSRTLRQLEKEAGAVRPAVRPKTGTGTTEDPELVARLKATATSLQTQVDESRAKVAQLEALLRRTTAAATTPCPTAAVVTLPPAAPLTAPPTVGPLAGVMSGPPGERRIADIAGLPMVYVITPTYARPTQKADLIRLCYTLRLVPNVHWIVVEDAIAKTQLVTRVLAQCNLSRTEQVAARTPVEHRRVPCTTDNPRKGCPKGYTAAGKLEQSWMKPRGVAQRNGGLEALRQLQPWTNPAGGAFYFADDDNTYSLELFEVIRHVAVVSVWEVGLSGGLLHEGPQLHPNGTIRKWHVGWRPDRPFPIDMAAFGVNVNALRDNAGLKFVATAGQGNLESNFLLQVVPNGKEEVTAVQPRCNCVLVWHTRTEHPLLNRESKTPSDPSIEV